MMTVTTWIRACFCIRPYVMTMQVASIVGRIRQVSNYESLVIRDVTERSVLMVKGQ